MAKPSLTLYLDVVSPFAYLAYEIITKSPVFAPAHCDVQITPIFFGGIMSRINNKPPGAIPHKGEYISFEMRYWARRFDIPLAPGSPEPFPQPTLHLMRAVTAVTLLCPERLRAVLEACERVFWMEHAPISKPEVYGPVITGVLGEELGGRVLALQTSEEVKALLMRRTNEAFDQKAFGLPWFKCVNAAGETQCFWGVSHLGLVIEFLGLDAKADPGFRAML